MSTAAGWERTDARRWKRPSVGTGLRSRRRVSTRKSNFQLSYAKAQKRNGKEQGMNAKQAVAIFCFEEPGSAVGRFAADAARLLAAQGHGVYVFSRMPMNVAHENVTVRTIGESDEPDLIGRVRTFTLRSSAALNAVVPHGEELMLL